MARPWQYTRSRRLLMQGVMWLVLGGTVAVAALVSRIKARSSELGPPETQGAVEVLLPKGWERDLTTLSRTKWELTAREPVGRHEEPGSGRVIKVTQEMKSPGLTPEDQLMAVLQAGGGRPASQIKRTTLGGKPAVRIRARVPVGEDDEDNGYIIYVCTVLRSGLAVTLQYQGPGLPGSDDEKLLTQIAQTMRIAGD